MQRKSTKQSPGRNADAKRYHQWVFDNSICAACSKERPLIGHHCAGSSFKHNKQLIGHWLFLGLCLECDNVVTNEGRKAFADKFLPQSDLWELQYMQYKLATDIDPCPDEIYDAIMDWDK